jgi:hypothetical protein
MVHRKSDKAHVSVDSQDDEVAPTIFERLFGRSSASEVSTTSYSISDEDDSIGSDTNTRQSTLSETDTASDIASESAAELTKDERLLLRFDRELRSKHRGACKAMTVSYLLLFIDEDSG